MENMINLEKFADGALAEKVNMALVQVLENMTDPNTNWKTKRKIVLDMTLETGEDRELTEVTIVAKTKLAPTKALATKIVIGTDGKGGVLASEYRKQVPGQSAMVVSQETGEILTTAETDDSINLDGIRLVK